MSCVGSGYEPKTVSLCLFTDVPLYPLGPVLVGTESRNISELGRLAGISANTEMCGQQGDAALGRGEKVSWERASDNGQMGPVENTALKHTEVRCIYLRSWDTAPGTGIKRCVRSNLRTSRRHGMIKAWGTGDQKGLVLKSMGDVVRTGWNLKWGAS